MSVTRSACSSLPADQAQVYRWRPAAVLSRLLAIGAVVEQAMQRAGAVVPMHTEQGLDWWQVLVASLGQLPAAEAGE